MICNDVKSMCDNMLWPPSIKDLHISEMNIGLPLSFFLNALLSDHVGESESSRVIRLKLSIGEDLVYAISQYHNITRVSYILLLSNGGQTAQHLLH